DQIAGRKGGWIGGQDSQPVSVIRSEKGLGIGVKHLGPDFDGAQRRSLSVKLKQVARAFGRGSKWVGWGWGVHAESGIAHEQTAELEFARICVPVGKQRAANVDGGL